MTLYRATLLDTVGDPFFHDPGAALRSEDDGGLLVTDGLIMERGRYDTLRAAHPDEDTVDLRPGVLLPGLVDTHVHYPQVRVIGGLGMPLLDWLTRCALPEEARLADPTYAEQVAGVLAAAAQRALVDAFADVPRSPALDFLAELVDYLVCRSS